MEKIKGGGVDDVEEEKKKEEPGGAAAAGIKGRWKAVAMALFIWFVVSGEPKGSIVVDVGWHHFRCFVWTLRILRISIDRHCSGTEPVFTR